MSVLRTYSVALVIMGGSLAVALLSLLPAEHAFHVPGYVVALLGKYLCYALLALALKRGPLELARQGVLSEDRKLRGTALEYLESLLPETVRAPLVAALAEHAGPRDVAEKQANTDLLEELRRSFRADLPAPSLGSDPD